MIAASALHFLKVVLINAKLQTISRHVIISKTSPSSRREGAIRWLDSLQLLFDHCPYYVFGSSPSSRCER